MNAEVFAEFLKCQGRSVIQTSSSYWCELGIRIYQAFPYHWIVELSQDELIEVLNHSGAIGLRYSTPLTASAGVASYHVVSKASKYHLESLPQKARYDIRKGLDHTHIEPIPFSRLAMEGWQLRAETLERQGREKAENQAWWKRMCESATDLPGFETWAAISDGRMVASLLAFTCDDYCCILYQQSLSEFMRFGVNNALTYEFTNTALSRYDISKVFYGLHSLDAPPTVDEFKFRMGYTAKPVRQRVVFHPALRPFANPASHALLKLACRLRPGEPILSKAEGLLRFYLQGLRPLEEQDWPDPIKSEKPHCSTIDST